MAKTRTQSHDDDECLVDGMNYMEVWAKSGIIKVEK